MKNSSYRIEYFKTETLIYWTPKFPYWTFFDVVHPEGRILLYLFIYVLIYSFIYLVVKVQQESSKAETSHLIL